MSDLFDSLSLVKSTTSNNIIPLGKILSALYNHFQEYVEIKSNNWMYFIYFFFNTSPSYTHAGFIKILMTEMKISANSNLNYKLLFNL